MSGTVFQVLYTAGTVVRFEPQRATLLQSEHMNLGFSVWQWQIYTAVNPI